MSLPFSDLEKSILLVFHYGATNETTDFLMDEDDQMLDELLRQGFTTSRSRNGKRLNIYLKNDQELHLVSRITNYPHFINLKR